MRRALLAPLAIAAIFGIVAAACSSDPEIVTVVETVEVVREVEVPGETIEVEKVVEKVVEKIVIATPTTPPAGVAKFGGTLRTVSQASVASLDSVWTEAYVTIAVASHIFETPLGWNSKIEEQPRMAESWELSSDKLTYTFHLRDGMTFHDGSPVEAGDMVASINRWLGGISAQAGLLREFINEANPMTVVDADTFAVNLDEPYGLVTTAFSKAWSTPVILPEEISGARASFETYETTELIGSGAYKFVEWRQGDRIVLEKYEGYMPADGAPDLYVGGTMGYVDSIIWLEVPDEETKIAGLETGEWDVVDGAGFDFFKRLQENPGIVVPVYKPGHRSFYGMIPSHPPFDNLKARQAALFATDVEEVMYALGDDELWDLCPAIYYCGTPLETDAGADEWYAQNDSAKAKALLAESPYDGETWVLLNPTDYATITPVGIVVKQQLQEIGFNVDMPAYDWATVVTHLGAPDTFGAWTSWGAHWCCGDPVSDSTGAGTQQFWPKIPYVSDLRLDWAQETDPVAKAAILDEFQIALYENVYWVYLGQFYTIFPHTADFKGFEVKAMPFYSNGWLDR
jgi:peptide/nickel transport system substrate-binding protein